MHSGQPPRLRVYYKNNMDKHIYREDAYGFDAVTNERRVILRDLDTGRRWDYKDSDLHATVLIDKMPTPLWEKMPPNWHPIANEEEGYKGYTDDPRKDVYNEYSNFTQRYPDRSDRIGNFNRRYTSFNR